MSTANTNLLPSRAQYLAAVAKIEQLSPAPVVLAKALKLLRDPNSELEEIGRLIKSDPALSSSILRVANSSFFGTGIAVSSLDHAIQKIGFRESIRLLNLSVAHTLASRDLGSYGIAAEDYWSECLCHGLFVSALAKHTLGADPDEAYTAGLLRYIGRLAINQVIHDLGGGLFWDGLRPLDEWEVENVGCTQAQAAATLLQAWNFPPSLVQAVRWQQIPQETTPPNWLAEALNFASQLITHDRPGTGLFLAAAQPLSTLPDHAITRRHPLELATLNRLLDDTRHSFAAIQHSLRA